MKKDVIDFYVVKNQFLDVFSTNGPIVSASMYKKITSEFWFYMW